MIAHADRRRVLLVLGMHRSGTSATTRVVNLLGATLGDNLVKPGPDNPDGFWEHAEAVRINDMLLEGLGRTWYDMREMPKDWLDMPAADDALGQIEALIRKDFQPDALWAVKDPRMCLTAPLWIKALQGLDYEVDCLFVVRDPREVVNSLNVRNGWARGPLFLMWVQYLMEAEAATGHLRRSLITFDELLLDWRSTMRRIAAELELAWPAGLDQVAPEVDAFLSKGRRNHVADPTDAVTDTRDDMPELAAELYQACLSISCGEKSWESISARQKTYRIVADLYSEHVDQLLKQRWQAEAVTQEAEARASAAHRAERHMEALGAELRARRDDLQHALAKKDVLIQGLATEVASKDAMIQGLATEVASKDAMIQELATEVASKDAMIQELATEVASKDAMIQGLATEVASKDAMIQGLAAEVASKDVMIQQLVTSTSWRITAPLRWIRKAFTSRIWKARLERSVRSGYERLPLSTPRRLALKGRLFRMLAPLIRTTRSYRAWQAFETQRGAARVMPPPSGVRTRWSPASAEGEVFANRATRVLSDLNAAAISPAASDYVALDDKPADMSRIDVRAIAFYLPQFHPIPENDEWWGRGFTEWTNVSKAVPQFVGHYQPRLPGELGFYDLRLVEVMRRQVELARHYGLQGFCFHYYWFGGRRLLERPLEQFVADKSIDFPFCVCWANENWSRRWDGMDQDILVGQQHSPEDDIAFITTLEPLLRDPRYIRVDGRPLIVLYRPSILPDAKATQQRWRDHCRKVGIGEICLAMVQFDVEDPRVFGFDVAIEFPPHKLARGLDPINDQLHVVNPEYSGYVIDYGSVIERAREHEAPGFDMIRGVFPSWDNEARKPGRGYTFANATPARYREWFDLTIEYARQHPVAGESMVFINAWNEWAEGAHLEPDRRYGYAYLNQTRAALLTKPEPHVIKHRRVAIVSHDANPHGAQYLALNMARELRNGLSLQVDVLLMSGGPLASAFAETAQVHDLSGMPPASLDELLVRLRRKGVELIIANTAVSGRITRSIAAAGLRAVTLVHELPKLIRDYGLESAVRELAKYSDKVVLPSEAVAEGLKGFVDAELLASKSVLRPQGLFTRSKYRGATHLAEARANLRTKLGLQADARVVLAVGYADRRKGVDLLLSVAAVCCKVDPMLHFVWVGHADVSLENENAAAITRGGLESRFHFVGMDFQTDDYYAGADLYALTSREDPFPSVVLESLSVGTPVVAFADTGGGADLVKRSGGVVVPAFDIAKYAAAITGLLADDAERSRLGKMGVDVVDAEFSFRAYVMDLLCLGGMQIPRVSVVVPNFNYARYLPERLASIAAQSVPVYEIIFLDDGSSDDSIETVQQLRHSLHPEPRIVINQTNSGSVFRQWQRGVQLARGDYVWIAEADDLAKPDFLEHMLRGMSAAQDVLLGYCQSEAIDEQGRLVMRDYLSYTNDLSAERWTGAYLVDGAQEVDAALGIKNTIPNVSAVLFRRQALLEVMNGQLDQILRYKVAGDWLVYLHILRSGRVFYDPQVSNRHRRHNNSVTLRMETAMHYQEVVELQECARSMFSMSARSMASAEAYRAELRDHLGVVPGQAAGG
jgi:glycosyltransferase involved in cell wall biosynthesis